MDTQPKLFALNTLLFISLLLQLTVGIWLFLITRGLVTDSAVTWIDLHAINGLILAALITIHLFMNRKWIGLQLRETKAKKKTAARRKKTKKKSLS